jgi:hypothetical protein
VQSAATAQNRELGFFYFIIISQLLETRAPELIIDAMFFAARIQVKMVVYFFQRCSGMESLDINCMA